MLSSTDTIHATTIQPQNQRPSGVVRCAIYTRVSTDEQTRRDYNSLESQRDICRHAIALKEPESWTESDYFSDGGWSGKDLERPEIQRLLAEARAGNIGAVIVYKLPRVFATLMFD